MISASSPAAFPATADLPLYNFNRLGRLGQNPDFVREIKQLFMDQVPQQVQELRAAIEAPDWEKIAHLAHNLKSMFGNLSLDEVASQLRQVEDLAKQTADQRQQLLLVQAVEATATLVARLFQQDLQQTG